MTKRIVSLVVALCLLCSMMPMSASATSIIASGTCGANLSWQLDENGLLTISGTGAMTDFDFYDYAKDDAPWADYSTQIKSVVVNDGVTSVGEDAFWGCDNLLSIEIDDSVTSLGDCSIYGCSMLTSVNIGKGLTTIGSQVFDCCDNLSVIEIDPDNQNFCSDESSVIYDAEKTTVVRAPTGLKGQYIIPNSVTHIASDAFMHCEKLTGIVMQDGIVAIGSGAFAGCLALTSVEIPYGVTQIEDSTFSGCNFSTVVIPNTVNVISRYAFYLCENIRDVFYPGTKSEWSSIEVYRDNEGLTQAPYIHFSVTDPINHWRNTEVICGGEKYNCEKCDCGYMRDENGEPIVTQHVFDREVAIEEYLKTPATCTAPAVYHKSCECGTKGEETFVSGDIDPQGHLFIDGECFRCDITGGNCGENLKWSLDTVGVLSIWGTGAMENYYTNYEAPWSGMTDAVVQIVVDTGVTTIGSSAFSGCGNLISVTLPSGITRIGDGAFIGCNSIKELPIPSSITYIGSSAFDGCSSLTTISIPYGITEIRINSFAGCSSLTDVFIPESVTAIGPSAFDGCSSLSIIDIPDDVTSIGYYAFHNCVSLTNITLPGNLLMIDKYTFMGCTGLETITIPDKVTSIGDLAFHNCKGLTSIVIPSNVTTISNNAFAACKNILDIYYGGTTNEWSALGENTPIATYIHYNCAYPDNHWTTAAVDATCGENGFSYEYCNCGYRRNDITIPATGEHVFDLEIVDEKYLLSEATCTSPALYYRSCVCGAIGSETFAHGDMKDHDYETIVQSPSCTEKGFTTHTCTICGSSYVDSETNAWGHAEVLDKAVAATCTTSGLTEGSHCERCGEILVVQEIIDALDHSFENGICTICGAISDDFFGADEEVTRGKMCYLLWAMNGCPEPSDTTHAYVDISEDDYYYTAILWAVEQGITTGATETIFNPEGSCLRAQIVTFLWRASGKPDPADTNNPFKDVKESDFFYTSVLWAVEQSLQIANVCGDKFGVYRICTFGQILGDEIIHFEETISATEPTCTETGLTAGKKCSVCEEILIAQEEVPALGHTEEIIPAAAPTCTETGLTEGKKCSVCNEILVAQESIDALGHDYEVVITAPNCENGGYTTYTCTVCGDSYVADETDALGHTEEVIPAVAATCTENGLTEGKKCSVCKEILIAQEEIPALGHDWNGTDCTWCGAARKNPFTDVPDGSFYINPVLWAVENGITNGATATTFNPNGQCQRAQVVTFLWRAFGCPDPVSSVNPFVDVKESDFYYKPVLWAVEQGITNGIDGTHFGPFVYCNRAQVVTFLWRANGSPKPTTSNNPFTDVDKGSFYIDPVLWAVEHGITNGIDATTFGVGTICNRAQVVTFLYRAFVD